MATLLLSAAGSAIGSAIGGTVAPAIGQAVGAIAGRLIDEALFARGEPARQVQGPRLRELDVQGSNEGAPIPRAYGSVRLAGQLIWATRFEEVATTTTSTQTQRTGKFGRKSSSTTSTTTYAYYGNFAVGLCEGEITRIGRIWADGRELNLAGINYRAYLGSESQSADPLIAAKEGGGNAPAYRGLAYVVFDRLALEAFGNRLPQLSFEVFRALDDVERQIKGIDVIPGATEFGYDTVAVQRVVQPGEVTSENQHALSGATDWRQSMDQLDATCPQIGSVALVVAWFGNDLRCGTCEIRPGIELVGKITAGRTWQAGGVGRAGAHAISHVAGLPAFGSTPADISVLAAIADLKARGKAVVFYPFVMMDIPAGNGLSDPYTGAGSQAAYPWRGRITCTPAPGTPGSVDKTAAAATQVAQFFGTVQRGHFAPSGETIAYAGPAEWSYRRMILHYAHLCAHAGGVDAFLIGSEMVGLTTVRGASASYPAVAALVALANDARAILGPATKISYAADWSEYFGHQPADGSGDVFFHLDPLWAAPAIDVVGIDNYMPLSDWREGDEHRDAADGAASIYELDYLRGNIAGGEGFDWYYASAADRNAQQRTPITDGAYGKPWVYRYKDIKNWWSNQHFNRPGGVEAAASTAWIPQSKPIWFTEAGCPAVDKGSNQPNVFFDPKSAESMLPHFSSGARDDFIQRRALEALISYWDPDHPDHVSGNNPISAVYGAPMVDAARLHIWAWDARPYPLFPYLRSVWSDGANWELGHWLSGRLGSVPLGKLVAAILEDHGFDGYDTQDLHRVVDGFVIDRIMSVREALEPLRLAYRFDAIESGGQLVFRHYEGRSVATLTSDDLAARDGEAPFDLTRAQETELPATASLNYLDRVNGYRMANARSRRLVSRSRRLAQADLPIVMAKPQAQDIAERWLQDVWIAREVASFGLPPSRLALEPGDIVRLQTPHASGSYRLTEIADGAARDIKARAIDRTSAAVRGNVAGEEPSQATALAAPALALMDVPVAQLSGDPVAGVAAAWARPWPGGVDLYRSGGAQAFSYLQRLDAPAAMGEVVEARLRASAGPYLFDEGSELTVGVYGGALASVVRQAVLNGSNLAAIEHDGALWELIQFREAQLVAPDTYALRGMLRGQAGTEDRIDLPVRVGARFVLLDGAVSPLALGPSDLRLPVTLRFGPASRDIGDATYRDAEFIGSGIALRPLSPVHARARRDMSGVMLSWVRRGRLDADSWESFEVPLGETAELYEIDILDGAAVKRTLQSSAPSVLYSAAQETADWGGQQSALSLAIHQMSDVYGRGNPLRITLNA